MIARLKGLLDWADDTSAIIDVGGVGYLVFTSARTLGRMGTIGEAVTLFIETHVREDHIHLYGFLTRAEQSCFRLLQTVQGVGAKAALSILSALSADEVFQAIAAQDRTPLTRADGVGPKLATRIVNELKDQALNLSMDPVMAGQVAAGGDAGAPDLSRDAVSALVNLGYGRSEAFGVVTAAAKAAGPEVKLDALITAGLKELSA